MKKILIFLLFFLFANNVSADSRLIPTVFFNGSAYLSSPTTGCRTTGTPPALGNSEYFWKNEYPASTTLVFSSSNPDDCSLAVSSANYETMSASAGDGDYWHGLGCVSGTSQCTFFIELNRNSGTWTESYVGENFSSRFIQTTLRNGAVYTNPFDYEFSYYYNSTDLYPDYDKACFSAVTMEANQFQTPYEYIECFNITTTGLNTFSSTTPTITNGWVNILFYLYSTTNQTKILPSTLSVIVGGLATGTQTYLPIASTTMASTPTCDNTDLNFLASSFCYVGLFLFTPSPSTVQQFAGLYDILKTKAPFNLYFSIYDNIANVVSPNATSSVLLTLDFNHPKQIPAYIGFSSNSTAEISKFGTIRPVIMLSTTTIGFLMGSEVLTQLRDLAKFALYLGFLYFCWIQITNTLTATRNSNI